jgi:hypothetical protein
VNLAVLIGIWGDGKNAKLIEEQIKEKDRECSGIGPRWRGKGSEICFFFFPISIRFGLPI